MTIAVTGATGFVGRALLDCAAAAGLEARGLARKLQPEQAATTWIAGDLADRAALRQLVRGAEVVIHVAGVVNAPNAAGFEEGNVAGTLNMIHAALDEGVSRFVFVSSLSAREPALSDYGASKARAEKLVRASGLDWTIVRPPAVYGPRDREMFELFRAARWGVVPVPAGGRTSVIHVEDLARLLLALVPGREAVAHACFEPDDGRPGGWGHYELARAIGAAVGRRPWVPGLSATAMQRAARVDRLLRGRKAKLTFDRARYMAHPDWVVTKGASPPKKLWQARIETREGLRSTAQWYRENGWL